MRRQIRLTENDLHRIVKESVNRVINEAENGGWIVDTSEAQEAYDMAVDEMGEETVNAAIVSSLGDVIIVKGRQVLDPVIISQRQPPGRIILAEKNLGHSGATFLTRIPGVDDRWNILVLPQDRQ